MLDCGNWLLYLNFECDIIYFFGQVDQIVLLSMQGVLNIWGNYFEIFVNKFIFNNFLIRFDVFYILKSDIRSFNFFLNVYFLGLMR